MVTSEESKQKCERFIEDYLKPPYDKYLGPIGHGPIKNVNYINATLSEKVMNYYMTRGKLPIKSTKKDDSLDWCLMIGLRKRIPKDIELPSEYKGVKVFYHYSGEIKPL